MLPLGVLASARVASGGLPVTDTFTRADASSLGTTETGQAWDVPLGTAGIDTNRLAWLTYTTVGTYRGAMARVETGTTDVTVRATFGSSQQYNYEMLLARISGTDTYYRLQHQNGDSQGYLIRFIAGTETVLANGPWCPTTTHSHALTVREEGGSTRVIVHTSGVQRYSGLDSTAGRPMGTLHGLYLLTEPSISWPPGVYVDDFSITTPAY